MSERKKERGRGSRSGGEIVLERSAVNVFFFSEVLKVKERNKEKGREEGKKAEGGIAESQRL